MKKCTKCDLEKALIDFHKDSTKSDGYCCSCIQCVSIFRKFKKELLKEQIPPHQKKCARCKIIKNLEEFHKQKNRKCGRSSHCKACKHEKHKEKYKDRKHEYVWRGLLASSLSRLGMKKEYKTELLLGYTPLELKAHIESLWTTGMSWDNYGEWYIDHIIPINLFPPKTKPSIVNCLKNLRPLWATTREIDGIIYEGNLNRNKGTSIINKEERPSTILIDIDGTLIRHFASPTEISKLENPVLLNGVLAKFKEWDAKAYKIILTTGRKESMRAITEKQLQSLGLFWDHLIMGLGGGKRYLINDFKPNSKIATAVAVNVDRNSGLENVDLNAATVVQSLANLYGVDLVIKQ